VSVSKEKRYSHYLQSSYSVSSTIGSCWRTS